MRDNKRSMSSMVGGHLFKSYKEMETYYSKLKIDKSKVEIRDKTTEIHVTKD